LGFVLNGTVYNRRVIQWSRTSIFRNRVPAGTYYNDGMFLEVSGTGWMCKKMLQTQNVDAVIAIGSDSM
jgi:hypothetical protein